MNEKEILQSELSKAEKARRLFDLGKTRKEVADLVLAGNQGWAYNIEKEYKLKKEKQNADGATQSDNSKDVKAESPQQRSQAGPAKVAEAVPPPAKTGKAATKAVVKPVAGAKPKQAANPKAAVKQGTGIKGKAGPKAKAKAKKGRRL